MGQIGWLMGIITSAFPEEARGSGTWREVGAGRCREFACGRWRREKRDALLVCCCCRRRLYLCCINPKDRYNLAICLFSHITLLNQPKRKLSVLISLFFLCSLNLFQLILSHRTLLNQPKSVQFWISQTPYISSLMRKISLC